jgi:hypothetical protein
MTRTKYTLLILPLSLALATGCGASNEPTADEIAAYEEEDWGSTQQAFTETACSFGNFDASLSTFAPGQSVSTSSGSTYGTSTCTQAFRTLLNVTGSNGASAIVRYDAPLPTTEAACNAISVAGRLWETDPGNPNVHNLRKTVSGNGIFISGSCRPLQRATGLFPINNGNDWRWVTQAKSGSSLRNHRITLNSALN